MSEQENGRVSTLQRPTTDDPEDWQAYWRQEGQSWRTEPEIESERQKYLDERRNTIKPNITKGIYPFEGIKLNRADIEWLLVTHENGRGPVDWNDIEQRWRNGIDLRGADLCHINLSYLPLARLLGGLNLQGWNNATEEQRIMAAVNLKSANLHMTHLEGAFLRKAYLEEANLFRAYLKRTHFEEAHLERATLVEASLDRTYLTKVNLSDGTNRGPRMVDVYWGDGNIAVAKWSELKMLGEEYEAHQKKQDGKVKDKVTRIEEYEQAVRANRQLANALQAQGLNEDAARFAYRARMLQRVVPRKQGKFMQYLFSLFLDLLAGYGYKPIRSFIAYLIVIAAFAVTYFLIGRTVGPALSPLGSVVFSMTSFHGRGFFPGGIGLDNALTVLAALEAFVGLLIEVTFIATLTQRLFGK